MEAVEKRIAFALGVVGGVAVVLATWPTAKGRLPLTRVFGCPTPMKSWRKMRAS